MRVVVGFGEAGAEIEVPDERLVELGGAPPPPVADVAARVAESIEQPLEFPPLRQAVVPGDHVAIVLDDGVPRAAKVLEPIVECLVQAGIQLRDIQIIAAPERPGMVPGVSRETLPPGIGFLEHDPRDRSALSYLASTKFGDRVYLNRGVVDADAVILVGRVGYDPLLGYRGTSSGIFPGLADELARQRFSARSCAVLSAEARLASRQQADEVAWLLGVQFAVQVIAAPGSAVLDVVAGHYPAVQRRAQERLDAAWRRTAARRADVVVAGISSAPADQGFEELAAALEAAAELVREQGQLVLLSSVQGAPGPALQRAAEMQQPSDVIDDPRRQPSADASAALRIARAAERAHVYLRSRLSGDLVEDLFMTPIDTAREVQRLVDRAGSCTILNDAQLTHPSVYP